MDEAEVLALENTMLELVGLYDERHRFTAADICGIHKRWLGAIYEWAGAYRQVNISKGDFPFAAAARVPALMVEFEKTVLAKYTPCNFEDRADILRALAETHAELVLIHPFRVSMAVELATLLISAFRSFSGSRIYWLVSMRVFRFMFK